MGDETKEENDSIIVDRVDRKGGDDGTSTMIRVRLRRGRCREFEELVKERRERVRYNGGGIDRILHGRLVEEVVKNAIRTIRVGNVPNCAFPMAHLEPVEVDGRVRVGEGPRGGRVLGADGGEGGCAEGGGADPEGVAVGGGEGRLGGGEGEEVGEDGGAVVPVEGEGCVVGLGEGGLGEVGVVEEGEGEEEVEEEGVL